MLRRAAMKPAKVSPDSNKPGDSMKTASLAIAALALAASASAFADAIPYPGSGSENPLSYTFTATTTGDLSAYFYGSNASYDETLGVLVNGVDLGISGLQNHTTPYGTQLDFGNVVAGDVLTFYIDVATTGARYFSDKSLNADGQVNHVYATAFSGDPGHIPVGTYVAFEDLDHGGDFNYQDEQFVFTNTTTVVPEPAGASLLLAGLALLGGWVRRRRG